MNSDRIKNMTATAMLFALAIVLSLIESLLWQPINGAKLGLSNMVVMFAMTSLGYSSALGIGTLKSIFVFLTRGATAGLLSFGGFALSFCVMLILHRLLKDKLSYLLLSVVGALGHNLGQLIIISALYSSSLALYYLPFLSLAGIGAGILTATALRLCMPILKKISRR